MEKLVRLLTAAVFLSLTFSSSSAQYLSLGIGNKSCGAYVDAINSMTVGVATLSDQKGHTYFSESTLYIQWALAFISGIVQARELRNFAPGTETTAFVMSLYDWCTAHPDRSFREAVGTYWRSVEPKVAGTSR